MCGIVGIVTTRPMPADQEILRRMCERLSHRGPDKEGYFLDEGVGLGVRRLRILDPEGGRQPIANEEGTIWVVHNGEIYNFKDLRRELEDRGHLFRTESDTEVIVHAYEQYGVESVLRLRGMFAFALWDGVRRRLLLARDRVGEKPLLYARLADQLLFASEFEALLAHPAISRDVDWEALHEYLALGYVPAPHTAFLQIRKLEPGHWLLWQHGEITIAPYWKLRFTPKLQMSEDEAVEQWLAHLREAVRVRLQSDVPIGAFLSGGLDSSTVVALMRELDSRPVKTFSVGFEEAEVNELEEARRVARHLATDHAELIVRPDAREILPQLVRHYGEPFADSSAIPTYCLAQWARSEITVALTGDGGDEGLAGYDRYRAMLWADVLPPRAWRMIRMGWRALDRRLPEVRWRRKLTRFLEAADLPPPARYLKWMSACDEDLRRELYSEAFRKLTATSRPERWLERYWDAEGDSGRVDTLLGADLLTYLPNDLLVKMDIATMAHGMEARAPFLDHVLLEWQARLPERYKLRRGRTKYLLRRAMRGLLPPQTLARGKQGFGIPLGRWLRHSWRDLAHDALLSERAQARGLFRPSVVRALWDAHVEGRADHATPLWTLIMLELWFRQFLDDHGETLRLLS